MKKATQIILWLLLPMLHFGQELLQLAPPIVHVDSGIFHNHALVNLEFGMDAVALEYQFLGISAEPGSAVLYESPVRVAESGVFWARSTAPGFEASDWRRQLVLKGGEGRFKLNLLTPASEKYPGKGGADLEDGKRGTVAFNSEGWLGFGEGGVVVKLEVDGAWESMAISYLHDPRSWILGPGELRLVGKRKGKRVVFWVWKPEWSLGTASAEQRASLFKVAELPRRTRRKIGKMNSIELELDNATLPGEHPGAGSKAWIFLDEIILR